jgi:HD-like signal output (HDOD) protein
MKSTNGIDYQHFGWLPPMPAIVPEILRVTNKPDAKEQELAAVFEMDAGLASRVVSMANSAFFGQRGSVVKVQRAVAVVGPPMAAALAVSAALKGAFDTSRCRNFNSLRFWKTAAMVAALANQLKQKLGSEARMWQGTYLCGLLHELGLLAMVQAEPGVMAEVFREHDDCLANAEAISLCELELAHTGVDHHAVGGCLARQWQLPDEVISVIESHHVADFNGDHWPLVRFIGACACFVSQQLRSNSETSGPLTPETDEWCPELSHEDVEQAWRKLESKMDELNDLAGRMA